MGCRLLGNNRSEGKSRKSVLDLAYQRIGIYDLPYHCNRLVRLVGLAVFIKELLSKLISPTPFCWEIP